MSDLKPVFWESGLEIKPVYTEKELAESGGVEGVGQPGEFPYTRGIHKHMYRSRPFTMRQYSGFGTATETHERFLFLIKQGNTGLNVAFDLPTQCGLDSDNPMARGEVGRVGMAVDTLADIEEAFADIPLNEITVSMTINGSAVPIMAMYFAMARKRGYDLSKLRGTAQNDILKEFVGRGTWIFPVNESVKLVGDTIEFCANHAPLYSPVSVCGYHIRESGADPVQEMAYGLAIAQAYLDHSLQRDLDVNKVAKGITFNFDIYGNLWEQVCKFRAGRRLWARILKNKYGVTDPKALKLRMIAGGGGGGLTPQQAENNIMRGAYYALASALSGTQTMALCSFDEAYTIPSEHAAKLSLRTMQLLIHEIGLADTVDPLAGSYFIESMTNESEQAMVAEMEKLENDGGVIEGIAEGRVQASVNRAAYEREMKMQSGEVKKVGVNCFTEEEEAPNVEFHNWSQKAADHQIDRMTKVKASRDDEAVKAALDALSKVAKSSENVMPTVIDAVETYATVGEICDVLKEVYGTYKEPIRF
ncbi:MAG: acyl-CoA mutase large subunit family protein [Planctomycetota bacterium]|jgi:methylmalonyl-CoA mutase N-terminal domain/subunit